MMIKFKSPESFQTAKNYLSAGFGAYDIYHEHMTIKFFTKDVVDYCVAGVKSYGVEDYEILGYSEL